MSYPFTVFIFFMILCSISALAQTHGNVAVGTTLTADGASNPWLSPSSDFAFGFKQLEDKDQFLLSIWYAKIPDKTVAWYLKSINPVPRGSTIRVDKQTGLVLLDPQNRELWRAVDIQTDHAFLNDTGNFVLKGSDGSLLWQSFRNYADTILPTQELDIDSFLNSRRSETNFSNGRFYLPFREDGNLVLTTRSVPENSQEDAEYYNSQTSDTANPSNTGSRVIFGSKGNIYVILTSGETKPISPVSDSSASENYYRATLEFDGVFILYSHPRSFSGDSTWTITWAVPENICLNILGDKGSGACGYNNVCSMKEKRPVCDCPTGYAQVDPNDRYGSCKPNFNPTCDEVLEQSLASNQSDLVMLEQDDVDWPLSDYQQIYPTNSTVCNQSCLQDCFCAVAIFRSNSCWKKKLPLSNGRVDTSLNAKAFIKSRSSYAPPPPYPSLPSGSKPKDRETLIIVGSVLLGSSFLVNLASIGAIGFFFYLNKRRKPAFQPYSAALETNLRCFTFKELAESTRGFKEELGSGSFGVVYKGKLTMSSGDIFVAVKKLNRFAQDKEFRAEVNSIGKTNHKNLVRLVGFCDEGQHRLLVYEFMSNGTLASFLFSEEKPSWNLRKQIAIGIARGLLYLHEECSFQIIHCDIKPQNILLDDYNNARIADFGLAKLLDINNQSQASRTNVRGTKGYVAPEWFRNNKVTVKVDVYSFGVLLLEIISCRKCVEEAGIGEENWGVLLTDLVWDCFEENRLDGFVGNDWEVLNDPVVFERFVMVGIWCIQENLSLRPSMRMVSQMLEGNMEVQTPPCPYPFSSTH